MDALPTMPRLLSEKGYLSLQTGKWWQGNFKRGGFTHGMTKGARHGDEGLDIGRKTMDPIYDFVRSAKQEKKPFFVWYAPMMPHTPHTPPEHLLEKYRGMTPSEHMARYWAMVQWFDETCGQLLDFLESEQVAKNTIVLYVTDNGWIQDPEKPKYAPRSKQSQYDTGLRTPIIVRWPEKVKPRVSDKVVSSLDLLPTVLAACKIPLPKGLAGVNLLDDEAVAARKAIFGECFLHTAVDLDKPETSLRWRWMIADDLKLIVPDAKNEPSEVVELYELKADPGEMNNLAKEKADRVEKMRATLDKWWKG
jgi:arylsulfatase A-like enzyme